MQTKNIRMKFSITIFLFLLSFSQLMAQEEKLVKDIDFDGKNDTYLSTGQNSGNQCQLINHFSTSLLV